jgi:hypothetical protein
VVTSFVNMPQILRATDLIAVPPRRLVMDREGLVVLVSSTEIPGFTKVAACAS